MYKSSLKIAQAAFLVFVLSGCTFPFASFPGNELPAIDHRKIEKILPKTSISYDFQIIGAGQLREQPPDYLKAEVQRVFSESDLFEQATVGMSGAPYHFSLVHEVQFNSSALFLPLITCMPTLTIIPCFGDDRLYLDVDVFREGRLIKQYYYKDHLTTWFQLFLAFGLIGQTPIDAKKSVIDNMLANFLNDVMRDKILSGQQVEHR